MSMAQFKRIFTAPLSEMAAYVCADIAKLEALGNANHPLTCMLRTEAQTMKTYSSVSLEREHFIETCGGEGIDIQGTSPDDQPMLISSQQLAISSEQLPQASPYLSELSRRILDAKVKREALYFGVVGVHEAS
jgi:hypothetical protein